MKYWFIIIANIHRFAFDFTKDLLVCEKRIDILVDRVNQLEQTVQSLSDENQTLIQKLYSKKGE